MAVVYVNGRLTRDRNQAKISFQDRGFQFADAIYEVVSYHQEVAIDLAGHLNRLFASAQKIGLKLPMSRFAFGYWIDRIRQENRITDGLVYLQVTRGVAERNFDVAKDLQPSVIIAGKPMTDFTQAQPLRICFMRDWRWRRVDIKTTGLLAAALAKTQAVENGFDDAWLVDSQGFVTEGTSANAWIINPDQSLQTRKRHHDILCGVTRQLLIETIQSLNLTVRYEKFTPEQALKAQGAFVTSATALARPVGALESTVMPPSSVATKLRQTLISKLFRRQHQSLTHVLNAESSWKLPINENKKIDLRWSASQ